MPINLLKNLIKNLAKVAIGSIVFILFIEGGIRVVYKIRNSRVEYVPIPYMVRNLGLAPPWMQGLRILDSDDKLLFRGRPYAQRKYLDLFSPMPSEQYRKAMLRRFSPSIPEEFKDNPKWEVKLNSEGFRDTEFSLSKPPHTIHIVCLGDSWTFGHNVDQDKSYPRQLAVLLNKSFPNLNIEVMNLGMLASTSHIGLKVLQERALSLNPDFVLVGFSMNDAYITGWHDKDVLVPKVRGFRLREFITENSELYKLLTYLGAASKFESITMTDHLKSAGDPNDPFTYESWVSAEALDVNDYKRLESRLRVTPTDYEKNIREMIRLIRELGAVPILLHNELRAGSPYQAALKRISADERVTLVDSCELLGEARRQVEKDLEERLNLQHPEPLGTQQPGPVEVVFRLYLEEQPVRTAMYIAGPHPQLGNSVPNEVAMYDDGTHGDQKAGDHVWSLAATFSPGQKVFYVYTNSGAKGVWQNVDLPTVRSIKLPLSGGRYYNPIETFGKLYLQADGFHTNATGYDLIARAVRQAVVQTEKFTSLTRQ